MRDLEQQVERARQDGQALLEKAVGRSATLMGAVRAYQQQFLTKEREWWYAVYDRERPADLGYYRKDAYLLADAPFLLRPTTALVWPKFDPDYYGVGYAGLRSLSKAGTTWFSAFHPAAYPAGSDGLRFLAELEEEGRGAMYTDALEDSLAAMWARDIGEKTGLGVEHRRIVDEFARGETSPRFDGFLSAYSTTVSDALRARLDAVPHERVEIHAGLAYADLQAALTERILKIRLWNECMSFLEKPALVTPVHDEAIVQDLAAMGNDTDAIARYAFTLWQQHGAAWSYAMGNTVDVSHRDLSAGSRVGGEAAVPRSVGVPAPFPSRFHSIVLETNIDSKADKPSLVGLPPSARAREREQLLEDFAEDVQQSVGKGSPHWLLDISGAAAGMKDPVRVASLYEDTLWKVTRALPKPAQGGTAGTKSAVRLAVGQLMGVVASPLATLIAQGLRVTGIWQAAIRVRQEARGYMRYGVWRGFEKEEAIVRRIDWAHDQDPNEALSYAVRTIALPYRRDSPDFDQAAMGDPLP